MTYFHTRKGVREGGSKTSPTGALKHEQGLWGGPPAQDFSKLISVSVELHPLTEFAPGGILVSELAKEGIAMRLMRIQDYIRQKGWKYSYTEEEGLGSITFEARGMRYHVWEFLDGDYGAESNVRTTSRQEDYLGDYEEKILAIMETWE